MPTGIYQRSEKEKERLRKMVKVIAPDNCGKRCSPTTEFKKGFVPWNKGKDWIEMRGDSHPSRNPLHKKIFDKCFANFKKNRCIAYGENHSQWKGGKTPLIMKIRNHPRSSEWRKRIFDRDGYTCKVCGDARGRNLRAHHYIQVADIIHTLEINSVEDALNTPILWKLSNGITLCSRCHKIADQASRAIKILYGGQLL